MPSQTISRPVPAPRSFPSSIRVVKVVVSGLLAGGLANRCWFVKPEKAQRGSWKPPDSLAQFPPFEPAFVPGRGRTAKTKTTKKNVVENENRRVTTSLPQIHLLRGRRAQLDCVSHLTNRRLIRANYDTSALKAERDRSQIPHLWNCVCLMNNAITISAVDHWLENPFGGGESTQSTSRECSPVSHNGTNRFIIPLVIFSSSTRLMNQTFYRHSSAGANRSGY